MINGIKKTFIKSAIFVCGIFLLSFQSTSAVIDDPFVWLEQMDSNETQAWVSGQNRLADQYFDNSSVLDQIKQRVYDITDLNSIELPVQRGDHFFYLVQKRGKNQKSLMAQKLNGEIRTLVDPNLISPDGCVSLTGFQVSGNGKYLTYGLSESGSDKQNWYFLNLDSGEILVDRLEGMKFSAPIWSHDNQGVYYVRFAGASNMQEGIYYHALGTDYKQDSLVYQNPELIGCLFRKLSPVFEGCFLLFSVQKGCDKHNGVYLLNLESHEIAEIFPLGQAKYDYIDESNGKLYFVTNHEVNKNKVIAINPFLLEGVEEIISEGQHLLYRAAMTRNSLVCSYFEDCKSLVKIFDKQGGFKHEVDLPSIGTVSAASSDTESFFLSFTNFVCPSTIYQHHIEKKRTDLFFELEFSWNVDDYMTTQVFFPSKDGTRIPMFITCKKGFDFNGEAPTLMYGYGGFNIPITPFFSPLHLAWMEMGGIYVSVCLRGGGEYGPEWYDAGRLLQKQNVFDDFISAGEWLIAHSYTNSKNLAITGRSNGGLLAGACLVQRPDLFAAVIPQVGVLDMLKFHQFTIGWAWMSEYGNPDHPDDYENLLSYSPYHHVVDGECYPATLITTADHDDRVVPLHSFKFAARLQAAQSGEKPVILRIHSGSGHGAGRSVSQQVEEYAEILYFLRNELDFPKK